MKLHQRTFQTEYPTFVKRDFMAHGRKWRRGQEFTWKEFNIPAEKVEWLFKRGMVFHKDIALPKEDMARVKESSTTESTDDLDDMTKNDLIDFARDLGLPANNTMSKDDIKARIRAET